MRDSLARADGASGALAPLLGRLEVRVRVVAAAEGSRRCSNLSSGLGLKTADWMIPMSPDNLRR